MGETQTLDPLSEGALRPLVIMPMWEEAVLRDSKFCFLVLNAARLFGQGSRHCSCSIHDRPADAHPQRQDDALHKRDHHALHRRQRKLTQRGGQTFCAWSCLCHGRDYRAATSRRIFSVSLPPFFARWRAQIRLDDFWRPTKYVQVFTRSDCVGYILMHRRSAKRGILMHPSLVSSGGKRRRPRLQLARTAETRAPSFPRLASSPACGNEAVRYAEPAGRKPR